MKSDFSQSKNLNSEIIQLQRVIKQQQLQIQELVKENQNIESDKQKMMSLNDEKNNSLKDLNKKQSEEIKELLARVQDLALQNQRKQIICNQLNADLESSKQIIQKLQTLGQ